MLKQLHSLLGQKTHLVFDFDKTIAQMEIDWSEWYPGIIKLYDQFDPNHGFEHGKNPHQYQNKLVAQHGMPLREAIRDFNHRYEAKHLVGFTPNQELVDLIYNLNSHKLYVYSSNVRSTVIKGLDELGITDSFTNIITADDVYYIKPDPEGFRLIEAYEDNKSRFLMIGDSSADRDAAEAAGIDFFECNRFEKYQFE